MKKMKNPWLPLIAEGYNCFACAPTNPYGLKMEFWEDGDEVVCLWHPNKNYEGWLGTLHGGIQSTLLDELGGWWIGRKMQTSAMTTNLNVKYRKPVPSDEKATLELRCHLKEQKRSFVILEMTLSVEGEVCTSAEATYFCFSKEKALSDFRFQPFDLEEEQA